MSSIGTNELKTIDGTKSVQVADIADGNVGIGVGQTWQDVTASRELDVEYTNDTGRPISVMVSISEGNACIIHINSYPIGYIRSEGGGDYVSMPFIVPNNQTYLIEATSGTENKRRWSELR